MPVCLASKTAPVMESAIQKAGDMLRPTVQTAIVAARRRATCQRRTAAAAAAAVASQDKREGDISDSFASLAGIKDEPLPDHFRQLKLFLVEGREEKIQTSWNRLLERLRIENDLIAKQGSKVIPEVQFDRLDDDLSAVKAEIKKRGVAVIRGVIPEHEARGYKFELEEYIQKNPQTKGVPSPSQPFFSCCLSSLFFFSYLGFRC